MNPRYWFVVGWCVLLRHPTRQNDCGFSVRCPCGRVQKPSQVMLVRWDSRGIFTIEFEEKNGVVG